MSWKEFTSEQYHYHKHILYIRFRFNPNCKFSTYHFDTLFVAFFSFCVQLYTPTPTPPMCVCVHWYWIVSIELDKTINPGSIEFFGTCKRLTFHRYIQYTFLI